eukprot:scaffold541128_cov23-Prasinocladus_malaysianus.AAC.1
MSHPTVTKTTQRPPQHVMKRYGYGIGSHTRTRTTQFQTSASTRSLCTVDEIHTRRKAFAFTPDLALLPSGNS